MKTNKELELAWEFVNHTDRHVFLTGKAGTGKTTFLHTLKRDSLKRLIVVAPTGVAAINAKGVTIHSFFQLPFGPLIPNASIHNNSSFKFRFSKTKIDLIKSTDLLVIDEISMVRSDVLDAIDSVLKRYRNRNKPFGGIQVLMIGDLQQLSPVINENEWAILKNHYNNGYFFSSHVFQQSNALIIELEHIYRQENPKFIKILNEIRSDRLSEESIEALNKRYQPDFVPTENDGYISLTTHNRKAEKINQSELERIESKPYEYKAKVKDQFPQSSYPNNHELILKVGAQVMFIKNDSSLEKRYYNGKIGKVVWLSDDEVSVQCPDDEHPIIVTPELWENIKYDIDKETKNVTEKLVGSYSQMPLRLAWSITIHKSQGLTFERAVIDAESAFAHGQTYVALSRCKTLEGLVLKTKISPNQIISDQQVSSFTESRDADSVNDTELLTSKIKFQCDLIFDVFDYFPLNSPIKRTLDTYYKNRTVVFGKLETPLIELKSEITDLLKIASSFQSQIKQLAGVSQLPESNDLIQGRFKKAIEYFHKKHKIILELFDETSFSTDNSSVEKDLEKSMNAINELLNIKSAYFSKLNNRFSVQKFLEIRAKAQLDDKKPEVKKRTLDVDNLAHAALFELLRELRNHIANSENVIHYQIFTQKALLEMCDKLPTSKAQLLKIKGMGKVRVKKYGDDILEVIREYCEDNEIAYNTEEPIDFKPKETKIDTKEQSLQLFKTGLGIEEIAKKRGLHANTIFGHLAHYIPTGEIEPTDLISKVHFEELSRLIQDAKFENLSDLKHQLDEKYSYGEIKIVLNDLSSMN